MVKAEIPMLRLLAEAKISKEKSQKKKRRGERVKISRK